MSLTEDQITKGRTYTVTLDRGLSAKRFRGAVSLVKGIDGQHEDYVYDPQNPNAYRTGYAPNEDPERASAKYDGATRTWTVTIPAAGSTALSDLRALARAYDAEVEVAGDSAPAAAPVPQATRPSASSTTQRATRFYGTDMAEYADGFSPEERRAFGGA